MRKAAGLLVLLALAGCQSLSPCADPLVNTDPKAQLVGVAESVEESLRVLAKAQEIPPESAINSYILAQDPTGLGKHVDMDWAGPIEPLLQKICDMSDYHLKVFGPAPAIPVLVSVSAKHRLLADILKDAGLQAGKRAVVMVFPSNRVIELRYTRM